MNMAKKVIQRSRLKPGGDSAWISEAPQHSLQTPIVTTLLQHRNFQVQEKADRDVT